MNKKLIIIMVAFALLIIAALVCFIVFKNNKDEGSKALELSYQTNGGVPYEWKYEIEDPSIVKLDNSYVAKNENNDGRVGAPIITNYVFKGLKEGTTTVTFKYVSIVDGSLDKEEKNTIKVDKNLNISLVGQNK